MTNNYLMLLAKAALGTWMLAGAFATRAAAPAYPPEFEPVVGIFSGLAYADHDMIRSATTDDFLLLEIGEVWDREFLLSLVKPSQQERKNHFSIISVERFDGVALISYWNKAVLSDKGEESTRAWLESVVAVETEAGWKLKQMHSTRIEPEMLPANIELAEHMLDRPSTVKTPKAADGQCTIEDLGDARARFNHAIGNDDFDAIAEILDEDVVLVTGTGSDLYQGRKRQVDLWRSDVADPERLRYVRETRQVQPSALYPLALEAGTWTGYATDGSELGGEYSAKWRCNNRRWLLEAEIFMTTRCSGWLCDP